MLDCILHFTFPVGGTKYKRMLKSVLVLYVVYNNQICLNLIMGDHYFSYITKLGKKKKMNQEKNRNYRMDGWWMILVWICTHVLLMLSMSVKVPKILMKSLVINFVLDKILLGILNFWLKYCNVPDWIHSRQTNKTFSCFFPLLACYKSNIVLNVSLAPLINMRNLTIAT